MDTKERLKSSFMPDLGPVLCKRRRQCPPKKSCGERYSLNLVILSVPDLPATARQATRSSSVIGPRTGQPSSARPPGLLASAFTKRNSDVLHALLQNEDLQTLRAQVECAGCEVLPAWPRGAIVLVPLTDKETTDAGVQLCTDHILIFQENQSQVARALAAIPKQRGPPSVSSPWLV